MDGAALAFHLAEPGALAFGKLADGKIEFAFHAFPLHLPGDVERKIFVFQAVIGKLFGPEPLVEQGAHFFDHTLLQAFFQTFFDALAQRFGFKADAENHRLGDDSLRGGVLPFEFGDFECAQATFPGLGVSMVVQRPVGGQKGSQFGIAPILQFLAQQDVERHFAEAFPAQGRRQIQAAATAEHGGFPAGADIGVGGVESLLVTEKVVFLSGIRHIDKMIRNLYRFALV